MTDETCTGTYECDCQDCRAHWDDLASADSESDDHTS